MHRGWPPHQMAHGVCSDYLSFNHSTLIVVVLAAAAFGEVKKRVRTTAGGSTGSVRNLRIREDTAKYLLNLDTNSAHYDPKSRSMREDPNPNKVMLASLPAVQLQKACNISTILCRHLGVFSGYCWLL